MAWGQSRTACAIGMPGVDAEAARAVRGGLHHAALVAPSADHQQLDVPQLGMPLAAHFDEEGVEVDVEDAGAHA